MVEDAAAHTGLCVVSDQPTVVPHTFMGWDPKSVERLPNVHGELFPAFLTWRGALDKCVIDLMSPLFAEGLRPEVNCCVCVILVFSSVSHSTPGIPSLKYTFVFKYTDFCLHDPGITCQNVCQLLFAT